MTPPKFKPGDYIIVSPLRIDSGESYSISSRDHGEVVDIRKDFYNVAVRVSGYTPYDAIIWFNEFSLKKITEFERILLGLED